MSTGEYLGYAQQLLGDLTLDNVLKAIGVIVIAFIALREIRR